MAVPDLLKRAFAGFSKFPIILYGIEFEKTEDVIENVYYNFSDRTINFFAPFYSDGMITYVDGTKGVYLEESDLYMAGVNDIDTIGDSAPTNSVLNSTSADTGIVDADIFMNLRTKEFSQIQTINTNKVHLRFKTEMENNQVYDPFVILRKRSFIPYGISHEEYTQGDITENLNVNIKIDNLTGVFSQKYNNTEFENCKITIIFTLNELIDLGASGINGFTYDVFYVNSVQYNNLVMNCKCVDHLQRMNNQILQRLYSKSQCPWVFGSYNCGVKRSVFEKSQFKDDDDVPYCDGSWHSCQERENISNFGGFIGIRTEDTSGVF